MHKSPAYFIFHIYNIFKEVTEEIPLLIFKSCFRNISFLIAVHRTRKAKTVLLQIITITREIFCLHFIKLKLVQRYISFICLNVEH